MDDTPLEAGLMFTCKLKTKTEFQGRRALEEQKNQGGPVKKKVCFTLDNDRYVKINSISIHFPNEKIDVQLYYKLRWYYFIYFIKIFIECFENITVY